MWDQPRVEEWLRSRGAPAIAHPGGTLFDHLRRVAARLRRLGCSDDVQAAGATHAAYGTEGFDVPLLDVGERGILADLVGAAAERVVYVYCACDRARTWPDLPQTGRIWNRFTAAGAAPGQALLRHFADLTIINELDVLDHDQTPARRHSAAALRSLFTSWETLASPAVMLEARTAWEIGAAPRRT